MNTLRELLNPSTALEINMLRWSKLGQEWKLNQRSITENLVYFIESGLVELTVNDQTILFGAGSFMWIPARLPHALRQASDNAGIELYHLRFVTNRDPIYPNYYVDQQRWELRDPFARLLSEFRLGIEPHPLRLRAQLFLLLDSAFSPPESPLGQFTTQQFELLREIIDQSEDLRIDIKVLADALQLNQDYFSRLFHRSFGEPPRSWLVRQRIQRIAEELQTSSQSLSELANHYGYPDVYSFGKQFRKFKGMSPGKYRSMHSHTKDQYSERRHQN